MVDEKSSVIVDYQYDVKTRSDASSLKEYLKNAEVSEEAYSLIMDGAYASEEASNLTADKNMNLLTTGLLGRKPKEIFGKFELDGRRTPDIQLSTDKSNFCASEVSFTLTFDPNIIL